VDAAGDNDHAARGLQRGQQFVDQQKVPQVIDPERRLEAVGRRRFRIQGVHSGVAYHSMQGPYRPCAQSFGELACKGADRRERRQVERHGLHLARHARVAGQLIDGSLSAACVSTGEDNSPGRSMR
jgi:hypothetical protein